MDLNEKFYIYKLISPSGKIYIGQTNNPDRRWQGSGKGYKNSPHLYAAIQKYGWENFTREIIEENLSKREADEKEKYYIKLYDSTNISIGYNMAEGGTGGNHKETKPVDMYSLDGEYIRSFDTQTLAGEYVNGNRTGIYAVCKKQNKTYKGYRWTYKDEPLDWEWINNNARSKQNGKKHPCIIEDLDTHEKKYFESFEEVLKYFPNFKKGGFMGAIRRKQKTYLKKYHIIDLKEET